MKTHITILYLLVMIIVFSCKRNTDINYNLEPLPESSSPGISTSKATVGTYNSALCGGIFMGYTSKYYKTYGVCWSTHSNPNLSDYRAEKSDYVPYSGFMYSISLPGISLNTTYFAKSYAISPGDTIFGNQVTFRFGMNDLTVQQNIDAGYTPLQIYQAGFALNDIYGMQYQGGIIFYLNTQNGSGLVASPNNVSNKIWGSIHIDVVGTSSVVGTGSDNTNKILTAGYVNSSQAARTCRTSVSNSGWFLPSEDELLLMFNNLHKNGKGNFVSDFYWSSTQNGLYDAYCFDFNHHNGTNDTKDELHYCRCAKTF